ncbi:type I DNA topoisomerase [Leptospira idonii]|uniref:DNA topoisomerase n=1 Tax=Leptospira idonii TaxID=1193500 RepID=A0A4R9M3K5_9LEPT|nr:type I DNA topoisomerase [Leptospira idonii]TGN20561.1 type I DNA topoisomerase [Leptospira idonii]
MVESPTKAATLQTYLGKDWKVVATKGHIKDLPPRDYGIDFQNDYQPKYDWLKGKKAVFSSIRKLALSCESVYLASDPDREGEVIAKHIADELKGGKFHLYRLRLKEISKSELLTEIGSPSSIDSFLVESQVARRVIDRIFGFEISPELWKALKGNSLSAGRVQSTVLRWICQREEEIRNFTPENYVSLKALVSDSKDEFLLDYVLPEEKERLLEKDALEVLKKYGSSKPGPLSHKESLVLKFIEEKEYKNFPPPPFSTASLQETASRVLGMSSSQTMKIAQSLFEGKKTKKGEYTGLITYMRTDSTHVSSGKKNLAFGFLKENFPSLLRGGPTKGKTKLHAQGAHEGILPIDPYLTPDEAKGFLKPEEAKLYELIWSRFLESFMNPETGTERNYIFEGKKESWSLKEKEGKSTGYKGFRKNEPLPKDNGNGLKIGDNVSILEWQWEDKKTSPPVRYTEGSIVQKMEKTGVGRPSTYTQTIATLQKRKYIYEAKKKLGASPLGEKVNAFLISSFEELIGESFTKDMEKSLDVLAKGEGNKLSLIDSFYKKVLKLKKEKPKNILPKTEKGISKIPDTMQHPSRKKCPKCSDGTILTKFSKKGKTIYFCSNYPHCDLLSYEPV